MSSGEAGKGESEQSQRVQIPDFLQPFLQQLTSGGSAAFSNLAQQSNFVAPQTQDQLQGQQQARDIAGGAGGFLPTAQNQFLQTAEGRDLQSLLDPQAFANLTGAAGGQGLESFVPQGALSTLQGASQIPQEAEDALRATAGGDFLFGGSGFDQAVQAAQRSATPGIISGFGGRNSGLGGVAANQAGVDAFARQFGQERANQLGASQFLSGRGTGAAGQLAQLGNFQANRGQGASQFLGQLSDSERNRAMAAAGQLPGAGLAGSNILQNIGRENQQFGQFGIDRPQQAQYQLLQAALQGLNIPALLGQDVTGEQSQIGFGFG